MADFSLVKDSSPLYGLLEMASLRLPDSDEFEFNSRRRAEQGSLTSSSTDASSNTASASRNSSPRPGHTDNMSRRVFGDTGTGLMDMLIDLAIKNANVNANGNGTADKTSFVDNYTNVGDGTSVATNATADVDHEYFYRHSPAVTAIFCVAYLVVFVVGMCGNSMVINVVFRSPRMWTVTNYFIVNLALADILVIVFCVPATLMSNIFVPWVLGWVMCKLVPYVQGVSVAASVYSLIGVSLDRFLAIWWPMKCQITKRRARFLIFLIWVIAFATTIPWAMYFDLVTIKEMGVTLCIEVLPNPTAGALTFLIANVLLCYILPTVLITMCYILIWIKVSKRAIPTDTKDAQIERMQQNSRVKVVKMLVVVVILFVLSWLPLYVIFAYIKLGWQMSRGWEDFLQYGTPIAQWFGSSNSCINPILYCFFNKKFRRGFAAIWKSKRLCGKLRYYETVAMMSSSASSMRKSSYYVQNNNNASTRRVIAAGQDAAVSYICNNTGI